MKKFFFITVFFLSAFTSNSQVLISLLLGDKLNTGKIEFGLEGGLNWSALKNLDNTNSLQGFNLGFYFDFKLKNPNWMLNTGVIVKSPMGADDLPVYSLNNSGLDSALQGGSVARKLRYFNVPVVMKYSFKNHFFVKGGIQLGLRSKCIDEFTRSVEDKKDLRYKLDTRDNYHALDGGLALGIGYRLMKGNGMNLNLQYYYGLIDVVVDDSTPNQYNRVLYLTAGIPIGKNPKKNKKQKEQ
ncbi:porin family protein [Flavitalea sp.]|nr:porin family protein [Flavitalea sp.]